MIFQKRYKIIRKIGTGATASVFLAEDKILHEERAVKIIALSAFREEQRIQIQNEIQILQRLSDPQLPELIEVIEGTDRIYIVMGYIRGMDLRQCAEPCGISVKKAIAWILELCCILERLHKMQPPILFCDLKPENIIVQGDGTLALTDFGSARQCMASAAGSVLPYRTGTVPYAAPELYDETCEPDARADIYSLGAVGKYILSESLPEQSRKNLHDQKGDPYRGAERNRRTGYVGRRQKLWKILDRCMDADRTKRYSTCADIINEINQKLNTKFKITKNKFSQKKGKRIRKRNI